jgi:hypothetical protein
MSNTSCRPLPMAIGCEGAPWRRAAIRCGGWHATSDHSRGLCDLSFRAALCRSQHDKRAGANGIEHAASREGGQEETSQEIHLRHRPQSASGAERKQRKQLWRGSRKARCAPRLLIAHTAPPAFAALENQKPRLAAGLLFVSALWLTPEYVPRPLTARAAHSRGPTPSRCSSCRSKRWQASCEACR